MANNNYNVYNLSKGGSAGSRYNSISRSIYSDALGAPETAVLLRKVYLPLQPLEKEGYKVMEAYKALAEEGLLPISEYHPSCLWNQEDTFAKFYEANFYIPGIVPELTSPGILPKEFISTTINYDAPELDFKAGELGERGKATKSNFIKLLIPGDIAKSFRSTIPAGTVFSCNFLSGSPQANNIRLTQVLSLPDEVEEDPWKVEPINYDEEDVEVEQLMDIIIGNWEMIEEEEDRRFEECMNLKEKEKEGLMLV